MIIPSSPGRKLVRNKSGYAALPASLDAWGWVLHGLRVFPARGAFLCWCGGRGRRGRAVQHRIFSRLRRENSAAQHPPQATCRTQVYIYIYIQIYVTKTMVVLAFVSQRLVYKKGNSRILVCNKMPGESNARFVTTIKSVAEMYWNVQWTNGPTKSCVKDFQVWHMSS